jgi:hypothetical protein
MVFALNILRYIVPCRFDPGLRHQSRFIADRDRGLQIVELPGKRSRIVFMCRFRKAVPAIFLCLGLLLAGCASVLVAGASGGVAYTVTNVAYKTLTYPIADVQAAVHAALEKMDIKEIDTTTREDEVDIKAETRELEIGIELEKITPRATKMSVNAAKNFLFKDKATAREIIAETENALTAKGD